MFKRLRDWCKSSSSIFLGVLPLAWILALSWGGIDLLRTGDYGLFCVLFFIGIVAVVAFSFVPLMMLERKDEKTGKPMITNFGVLGAEVFVLATITVWLLQ